MKSIKKYTNKIKTRRFKYTAPNSKVKNRKRKNRRGTKKRRKKRTLIRKKRKYQSGGSGESDPLQQFYDAKMFRACLDDDKKYNEYVTKFCKRLQTMYDESIQEMLKIYRECINYNNNRDQKKKDLQNVYNRNKKYGLAKLDDLLKLGLESFKEQYHSSDDLNSTPEKIISATLWKAITEYLENKNTPDEKTQEFISKLNEIGFTLKQSKSSETLEYLEILDTDELLEATHLKLLKTQLLQKKKKIRNDLTTKIVNLNENVLNIMLEQGRDPTTINNHFNTGYNRVIVLKINEEYIVFTTMTRFSPDSSSSSIGASQVRYYKNKLYNVIYPELLTSSILEDVKSGVTSTQPRQDFENKLLEKLNSITKTGPVLVFEHSFDRDQDHNQLFSIKFDKKAQEDDDDETLQSFDKFMKTEESDNIFTKVTASWSTAFVQHLTLKNSLHNTWFVTLSDEILPSRISTERKTFHPSSTMRLRRSGLTIEDYSIGEKILKVLFGGVLFFELTLDDYDNISEIKDLTTELGI